MKKVFLMGDSIRKGYDRYVKESMKNIAQVYYPDENCKFSQYILRNVHMWKEELGIDKADAVHWNAGLWDTLQIYGDGNLTRLDVYADNIERIAKRIHFLFPGAKQIFATNTPVIESGYIKDFEMRFNADIEKYNEAAKTVLKKHQVIINDLYELLKDKPESFHSDQSHFYTADATELIGGRVNSVLCKTMGIDESLLIKPNKEEFAITCLKNDNEMYIKKGGLYERIEGI